MAIPPGFLDELRSRISLSGLIARRVKLVHRGREFAGLCPFHHEKTPSFYVVEDKSFFHCFGCGAHGDVIGFAMRADNLDFIEAVEKLAGEAGLAVPQATPQERERAQQQKTLLEATEAAAAFYEEGLWAPGGVRAREYLQGRGLDPETIRRFRLGWAPDDRQALRRALASEFSDPLLIEAGLRRRPAEGEPADYFRNRLMFPISDRAGRVIAFGGRVLGDGQPKYLNSPDSPLFEKGRVLYGWSAARAAVIRDAEGGPGAIVTEGYMDVIALHQAGLRHGSGPARYRADRIPAARALAPDARAPTLFRWRYRRTACRRAGDAAGPSTVAPGSEPALCQPSRGRGSRFGNSPGGAGYFRPNARGSAAALDRALGQRAWRGAARHPGTPRRSRAPSDGASRPYCRPDGPGRVSTIPPRSALRSRATGPPGRSALASPPAEFRARRAGASTPLRRTNTAGKSIPHDFAFPLPDRSSGRGIGSTRNPRIGPRKPKTANFRAGCWRIGA